MTAVPRLICWSTDAAPGATRTDDDGRLVHMVDAPAYFCARLWTCYNPLQVFMEIVTRCIGTDEVMLVALDDAVAAFYWKTCGGYCLPIPVLKGLQRARTTPGGDVLLAWAMRWPAQFLATTELPAAFAVHLKARADVLTETPATDVLPLVEMGELLADLLLLQAAAAIDMRRAERQRTPTTPRGDILLQLDQAGQWQYDRAQDRLLHPDRWFNDLPPLAKQRAMDLASLESRSAPHVLRA